MLSSVEIEDDRWAVSVFPEVVVVWHLSVKDEVEMCPSTYLRLEADQVSQ